MKFYTSDTHFSHWNIIKYSNRPFNSTDEMNSEMIKRWNFVVRPVDEVYHLGDFAFAQPDTVENILKQLNGKKHLIFGNHDEVFAKNQELLKYFESFSAMLGVYEQDPVERKGAAYIVLCHYGMRVWNKSHNGSLHLYGHSHGKLPGNSQSCDVGVDCWDYTPVKYKEIKKRLQTLPLFEGLAKRD